jgi:hypothetical protein
MRLKPTLRIIANADANLGSYAPMSQQAPKDNGARKTTAARRMPPASRGYYMGCPPDIRSRLFSGRTRRGESISCKPGLRPLQANGFQAGSDDGQEENGAYQQTSIALRKAVPRFGLMLQ